MGLAIVTINDKQIAVEPGTTILEAANKLNIHIPTLCHLDMHDIKMVNKVASCRVCVVEVAGRRNLAPACATPVTDGMVISTNTKRAIKARRAVLELLLSDHPFNCLTCAKSLDCELQALAKQFGIEDVPYKGKMSTYPLDTSSRAIRRELDKCILCRRCETVCNEMQTVGVLTGYGRGFECVVSPAEMKPLSDTICTFCGQCINVCPTAALTGISYIREVWDAINNPAKTVIVQTAPAVRVGIGEEFDMPPGRAATGKLVAGLRALGFDKVFDTDFAADLTIMEEAHELIGRLKDGKNLPILTSCCPGWVNFLEFQFPNLINIPSSCKSPQQMFGAIAKSYYAEKIGVAPEDLIVVSIMPCIAKKYEAGRPEFAHESVPDVDYVLTTRELAKMFREAGINPVELNDEAYDDPLGQASGAGVIFGVTGGVIEAALRTAYEWITGKELKDVNFRDVRGMEGIKEATVNIAGTQVNIAVTSGLGNARKILEKIESGEAEYHAIEIMACPGGCINGGGQPFLHGDISRLEARMQAIYDEDERQVVRKSHENPSIKKLYSDFLGEPGSAKAHEILHTHYYKKGE
ncbi:MAG TPA: NADH-dependent [FeFe] hydrogenase, group A6 [Spirochaetota bacterium]|nr:NADH-dependent [FeFe] hydrogenase, group A6 [Spirochaetota bacterium]